MTDSLAAASLATDSASADDATPRSMEAIATCMAREISRAASAPVIAFRVNLTSASASTPVVTVFATPWPSW